MVRAGARGASGRGVAERCTAARRAWQTPAVTPEPGRPQPVPDPAAPAAPAAGTAAPAAEAPRPSASYAVLLGSLALMWGSSYLFIKIGVETLPPLSLVFLRVLVGVAILAVVVAVTRTPLPRDPRTVAHLAVLGAVNIAIPFWLIGWAEQHIDSGLAGVLQSTAPFFTLVLAAAFVHDEHINRGRVAGIALGFARDPRPLGRERRRPGERAGGRAAARGAGRRRRLAQLRGRQHVRAADAAAHPAARPLLRPGRLVGDHGRHPRDRGRRRRDPAGRAGGGVLRPLARGGRHRLRLSRSSSGCSPAGAPPGRASSPTCSRSSP